MALMKIIALSHLKKELKYYADKNNEILSSKSWKVTKPLRKLGGNSNG